MVLKWKCFVEINKYSARFFPKTYRFKTSHLFLLLHLKKEIETFLEKIPALNSYNTTHKIS